MLWPVLAVNKGVVNYVVLLDVQDALICKELYVCELHVFRCSLDRPQADITTNNLHVQVRLDLPDLLNLLLESFVLLSHEDGPVLKGILVIQGAHGLPKGVHQGLNQEAA